MAVRQQRRPVGAVIVHHEAPGDLERCLGALGRGSRVPDQIVVVDNSTTDPARSAARSLAQAAGAVLVDPGANVGFGAGCNRGVAALDGCDTYFFVNQDAEVGDDDLELLSASLAASPGLAAVSPLIITADRRIWFAGGGFVPALARLTLPAFGEPSDLIRASDDSRIGVATDWLNGCALLVRAEAWHQVDGFDERFFLYWEDVDLSLRLLEASWSLAVEPEAEVVHHRDPGGDGLRTLTPLAIEHAIASRLLFVRHRLRPRHRLTAWPYTALNVLRLIALATQHRGRPIGPHVRAAVAGLRRGLAG